MVSGQAEEALMEMTGDPCDIYKFKLDNIQAMIVDGSLFKKIVYADSVGYVLTASTPSQQKDKDCGLIASHSYSLIAAKELSNGVQLVLLRNPWGQKEWDGNWGDSSPLWTPKYKAEVADTKHDFDRDNDGMFWMMFSDMVLHFDKVRCCPKRPFTDC